MSLGFSITAPPRNDIRRPGLRLNVPLLPAFTRRYDICTDEYVTGVRWFCVSLSVEPLRAGRCLVGVSARLTWGWVN